ncbi:MAG TPA: hypothetical protein VGB55_15470 [Tepidisphaeraceae bacterium]
MANAVKDLPDPLEDAASPSKASADDLLAQMADEAIDKLIADAERGGEPFRPPVAAAQSPEPPATAPEAQNGEFSEAFGETPAPVAQPSPSLATPVNVVEPHEEPAGFDPGVVIASEEPAPRHELHALLGEPAREQRSGLLLKPLEWFNAPFNFLPDTVRDVAGQVAIVTLVNALAVLLYIVLFRR